jgi:hypothetical protein
MLADPAVERREGLVGVILPEDQPALPARDVRGKE